MKQPLSEWPKKMPASDYAKRWYTSRTKETVINDIKRGHLPGEQELSGAWFVWVNADQTPAVVSALKTAPASNAAMEVAKRILNKQHLKAV